MSSGPPVRSFKKRVQYLKDDMAAAVESVNRGMGIRESAKLHGVPRSTLLDKVKGKSTIAAKLGRPPCLSHVHETEIKDRILNSSDRGLPYTSQQIRERAFVFCDKTGTKHPFNKTKGEAGYKWMRGFLNRNDELAHRAPKNLSRARAIGVSDQVLDNWFENATKYFERRGVTLLPEHTFNADETGFTLVPPPPRKVIARKGTKTVPMLSSAERGANITVIAAFSASGQYIPPFVIHPHQRLKEFHTSNFPAGTQHHKREKKEGKKQQSKSTFVDKESWLAFLQHFVRHRGPLPHGVKTVLFVDGHSSHVYHPAAQHFAEDNCIEVYALPAHNTNTIQPLDVGFFGPLKNYYKTAVHGWLMAHRGDIVTREHFGKLFSTAWNRATKMETAVNSFRRCGLFPFSRDAIPRVATMPSEIFYDIQEPQVTYAPQIDDVLPVADQHMTDNIFGYGEDVHWQSYLNDTWQIPEPVLRRDNFMVRDGESADFATLEVAATTVQATHSGFPILGTASPSAVDLDSSDQENIHPAAAMAETFPLLERGTAKGKGVVKRKAMSAGGPLTDPEFIQHLEQNAELKKKRDDNKASKKTTTLIDKAVKKPKKAASRPTPGVISNDATCTCGMLWSRDKSEPTRLSMWLECKQCASWGHDDCGTLEELHYFCGKCRLKIISSESEYDSEPELQY